MKRRDFLKGVMGAGAVVAVPSLVNADVPNKLPEGFKTEYKHVSYGLKDGVIQAYDPSEDSFIKKMGEGIQEGLDILDSMEYKELESHGELTEKAIEDAILDIKRFEDEKGVTISGYDANGNKQTEEITLRAGETVATKKHYSDPPKELMLTAIEDFRDGKGWVQLNV